MKYSSIVAVLIYCLLIGCGKNSDVQVTKTVSSTRNLLILINEYKRMHSKLPISLDDAVTEFRENISGNIPAEQWDYIVINDSYILICKKRWGDKIILGYPPEEVEIINIDEW